MRTNNVNSSFRLVPKVFLGALLALGACKSNEPTAQVPAQAPAKPAAQTPAQADAKRVERAQISNKIAAEADVVAIDSALRIITLRREDGSLVEVKAGEEVRNFAQIAVGDKLRVQYQETLTASLRPASESAKSAGAVVAAGRAEPGAKPGAGIGFAVSVKVKIESIDREKEVVVFSLASGELIARHVVTPEGREFVKGLKVGDTVQLDYTEALAITMEKIK